MDSPWANAEYFLFLATTYHFLVQIMILILVGQLLTLRVEFGEVCAASALNYQLCVHRVRMGAQ